MYINYFFFYRLFIYRCLWKKYNCEVKFYLLNKKIIIIYKYMLWCICGLKIGGFFIV